MGFAAADHFQAGDWYTVRLVWGSAYALTWRLKNTASSMPFRINRLTVCRSHCPVVSHKETKAEMSNSALELPMRLLNDQPQV